MQRITWKCLCYRCQRSIQRGRPTILFATDSPVIIGISHSTCAYKQSRYGIFQMCPPDYLSDEQTSFLVQAYYRLYNLPGGQKPNRELRICLATLLQDYPTSMINPMVSFWRFLEEYKRWPRDWLYEGDLETDFLRVLGQIQQAAREMPVGVEIDFRARVIP